MSTGAAPAELTVEGPVIVGGGLAGLSCAIELSPAPCLVITAGEFGAGTSTGWAQGGMAAAVGPQDDPADHAADTLAAGAGLCDPAVVQHVTAAAPETVQWLADLGARWDRHEDGSLKLGLEGAHSCRRIAHANGDGTGAELLRAVIARARRLPSIALWDHCSARRIVVERGRVAGLELETPDGVVLVRASSVVLATGGIGGLFSHTTNPLSSCGQGLALAHRAGAALRDIEFVQFHPTALDGMLDPLPLVSEAVRGEGAILVNELGELVLDNPLAARDVVSRAEWAQLQAGHEVFLDARTALGERFVQKFPSIHRVAAESGLDPATDLLPVKPAAHYHMGGVLVDSNGQSTVPGLYAVGEVSSTGLHGANRLASNSLLEAVVYGRAAARHLRRATLVSASAPALGDRRWPGAPWKPASPRLAEIRRIVTAGAGVLRDEPGLRHSLEKLRPFLTDDAGLVGHLLVTAALERTESRGAHTRTDFPDAAAPRHTISSLTTYTEGRVA